MKILAVTAMLALCACTARGPKQVLIPVQAPCVKEVQIPEEVPPAGELPRDARQASDLLGSIVLQLRGNERVLRALLKGCTE